MAAAASDRGEAVSGGHVLPRLRVRFRRRKPRGPEWWRAFRMLCAGLPITAAHIVVGAVVCAAATALLAFTYARDLRRWPCDREGRAYTEAEASALIVIVKAAVIIYIVGMVVFLSGLS